MCYFSFAALWQICSKAKKYNLFLSVHCYLNVVDCSGNNWYCLVWLFAVPSCRSLTCIKKKWVRSRGSRYSLHFSFLSKCSSLTSAICLWLVQQSIVVSLAERCLLNSWFYLMMAGHVWKLCSIVPSIEYFAHKSCSQKGWPKEQLVFLIVCTCIKL